MSSHGVRVFYQTSLGKGIERSGQNLRVILIIAALVLLFSFTNNADQETNSFIDQLKEGISDLTDQINLSEIKEDINDIIYGITDSINEMTEDDPKNNDKAEEITLNAPEQQTFSIANIELGSSKQDVENMYGQPKRVSLNEYHTNWHTYHENYQNFFMVAYNKDGKVAGLFTNQNLISSANGIGIGTGKEEVLSKMGTEPLTSIQKGLFATIFLKTANTIFFTRITVTLQSSMIYMKIIPLQLSKSLVNPLKTNGLTCIPMEAKL